MMLTDIKVCSLGWVELVVVVVAFFLGNRNLGNYIRNLFILLVAFYLSVAIR